MKVHELKIDTDVFHATLQQRKTYEIRLNDRGYRVGDYLFLRETEFTGEEMKDGAKLIYTGNAIMRLVTHMLESEYGLEQGWCIMSVVPASR